MLRLDSTLRKLQIVLAGAITTNQLPVVVCFSDKTSTTYNGGTTVSNTNSTTAVDICAAPGASTIRDIDSITVQNADTAAATVTIRYNDNGTTYSLFKCTLSVGDQIIYTHGQGWKVLDSSGALKSLSSDTVTLAGAQTLTNKTIALGSNTITGTRAEFNSALTDGDFATQAGTETLTNKTIALGSNTITGTRAQFDAALTNDNFAFLNQNNTYIGNQNITGQVFIDATALTGQTSFQFLGPAASLRIDYIGSGTNYIDGANHVFRNAAASEKFKIDSSGNALVVSAALLGYGTGAGGTVTQATSKSTAVTLNKPTGQITMNNAALAAGASVVFNVNNSVVLNTDSIAVGANNNVNYRVEWVSTVVGIFTVRVTNVSAGSLSDALVLNFNVFRGATS